jgi:hypothetical protein
LGRLSQRLAELAMSGATLQAPVRAVLDGE